MLKKNHKFFVKLDIDIRPGLGWSRENAYNALVETPSRIPKDENRLIHKAEVKLVHNITPTFLNATTEQVDEVLNSIWNL